MGGTAAEPQQRFMSLMKTKQMYHPIRPGSGWPFGNPPEGHYCHHAPVYLQPVGHYVHSHFTELHFKRCEFFFNTNSLTLVCRCLVHVVRSANVRYSKVRPLHPLCQFDICRHEVRYGCQREDSCSFAHSVIELKCWVLQQDTGECITTTTRFLTAIK